jgi:hypothetical protein
MTHATICRGPPPLIDHKPARLGMTDNRIQQKDHLHGEGPSGQLLLQYRRSVAGTPRANSRRSEGISLRCQTRGVDHRNKFQLKQGQAIEVVDAPDSVAGILSELETDGKADIGPALLVFIANEAALKKRHALIVKAVSSDRMTWVLYPKSGQLGTDLNRDSLAALLIERGVQPVRQVALDDVWSGLRFRLG